MERRNFIKWSGASLLLTPYMNFSLHSSGNEALYPNFLPDGFVGRLVWENDRATARLLRLQERDRDHLHFGGIPNQYRMYHAGSAADFIQKAVSAYINTDSEFYKSAGLLEAMKRAATFLNRHQHTDGTIDLLTTNFHSTPDTGFVVEPLCLAYGLLGKSEAEIGIEELSGDLRQFLKKAGDTLSKGGIHTPNHRWVVCMALARLHELFPNPAYVSRIETWLGEKIDIDPDGQYTERSTHIYSPLTNRCLITIARLLDKSELLEPVRRNLDMTLYYMHPNGELATEASGRQDQYQIGTLQNYWYPYVFMALKDRNGQFAAMANKISTEMEPPTLLRNLAFIQEDAGLLSPLPSPEPLPEHYIKIFSYSKLVRIRRGIMDASILAENPTFLTFHKGQAVLQAIRLASAFFGKGQFLGESVMQKDSAFVLRQKLTGPYFQPYPTDRLPGDGDWQKMPRSDRPESEVQELTTLVEVVEKEGKLEIRFDISGTDHVPVAIELVFRHGGTLSGVRTVEGIADAYLLDQEMGTYTFGGDTITFGPGAMTHSWTQLRGALPKLDGICVYITGETPFEWALLLS